MDYLKVAAELDTAFCSLLPKDHQVSLSSKQDPDIQDVKAGQDAPDAADQFSVLAKEIEINLLRLKAEKRVAPGSCEAMRKEIALLEKELEEKDALIQSSASKIQKWQTELQAAKAEVQDSV
mmetsp:Transcript_30240/g.36729  ORF Transcript_30240/g.36729 Transcript_30240/m.36729 type:complete len:122 (+) Transcript_30240:386-751(+)|eukprot:CAMPEP_0197855106 /NCGR_PEP_ID=MMETSP1438-20131217/25982_1 /TAXON_ID=1461541 /ORGANISM="Pterosperma sp., Strain CCMP1384" /LENGTH=121 /DNA_ID=CAMNT_0043470091 /DNA_START=133 /DNA_END=498 /DNA_ORIENTATION=+